MMPGELADDTVIVSEQKEASQLYNKGNYGYPLSGGGLELDITEALYLVESDRLQVFSKGKEITFDNLFIKASRQVDGFDVKYLVYRDMRSRGFIVKTRSGDFDISVYPRGMNVSNSRPVFMVHAVSERTELDSADFIAEDTTKKGYEVLYAVADEEGDVTYYKLAKRDPKGHIITGEADRVIEGNLISDRVFVFGEEDYGVLTEIGFFGKDIGGAVQLSFIESCYLSEKGILNVRKNDGKTVSAEEMRSFTDDEKIDLSLRMTAYYDLRSRGLVVKTGFKYGTHFRVYERSPDECHARYLVHAVQASDVTIWPEISRTVRLSGGVKKDILFCRVGDEVEYFEFKWFRP